MFCINYSSLWHEIILCNSPFISLHLTKWNCLCHTTYTSIFTDIKCLFDIGHDFCDSWNNLFFVCIGTSENMNKCELILIYSEFDEERCECWDFCVVLFCDNRIYHYSLIEFFEIDESLDDLIPGSFCSHECIMSFSVEAMN